MKSNNIMKFFFISLVVFLFTSQCAPANKIKYVDGELEQDFKWNCNYHCGTKREVAMDHCAYFAAAALSKEKEANQTEAEYESVRQNHINTAILCAAFARTLDDFYFYYSGEDN